MAFPATAAAWFLGGGIAVQDNARHLLPVCAVPAGIEKTQIGDIVLFVIRRDNVSGWRFIGHVGIYAGNGISIESVRQSPANGDSTITIVSHVARLGDLMRTVEELRASASVHEILSVTAVESD